MGSERERDSGRERGGEMERGSRKVRGIERDRHLECKGHFESKAKRGRGGYILGKQWRRGLAMRSEDSELNGGGKIVQ